MCNKKVALVTGAGRGIGRTIAIELSKEGYNIALNFRSNEEEANLVKEECEKNGAEVLLVKADVSIFEECEKIFKDIKEKFKRLDLLVNNAGITKDNLIIRMTPKDFNDVLEANLNSTFYCMKLASRIMMKQRYGKIISISSIVGLHGNAGQVNYSASKAGILGMTKSLAKELASRNVTVNAIAPGFIETSMTEKLPEDIINSMLENIPLAKLGRPKDIADTVVFLASDKANYITGQTISVDGGMSI
ncbi:3-oxoacyl-[acyl-carrier-protein] reductase [Miniphocaeibacter halophilus]|uniref:3-oxoacyl-[acyl-carrier-protein] reductase n=1 Tax=Miniphocaeibacter halophilus TaxID=2931922 RepID=A0AC61MRF1_9FIRM|nr:3-oxoacyl-[acyl-carrier-protein] reductase [Miniphocaeibacter halophilus]QQK08142.1 3-oxoacyl-[acyl-carrier-protein] reductase [Miniphocaeibacter halophilus]